MDKPHPIITVLFPRAEQEEKIKDLVTEHASGVAFDMVDTGNLEIAVDPDTSDPELVLQRLRAEGYNATLPGFVKTDANYLQVLEPEKMKPDKEEGYPFKYELDLEDDLGLIYLRRVLIQTISDCNNPDPRDLVDHQTLDYCEELLEKVIELQKHNRLEHEREYHVY